MPPIFILPAKPAPPATVNAPVVVDVDEVVFGKFKAPIILASVVAELPIKVVLEPSPVLFPPAEVADPMTISLAELAVSANALYPIYIL